MILAHTKRHTHTHGKNEIVIYIYLRWWWSVAFSVPSDAFLFRLKFCMRCDASVFPPQKNIVHISQSHGIVIYVLENLLEMKMRDVLQKQKERKKNEYNINSNQLPVGIRMYLFHVIRYRHRRLERLWEKKIRPKLIIQKDARNAMNWNISIRLLFFLLSLNSPFYHGKKNEQILAIFCAPVSMSWWFTMHDDIINWLYLI